MKLKLIKWGRALSPLKIITLVVALFIVGQFAFFIAHSQSASLMDSLVRSSLSFQLLTPLILLPILNFLVLQMLAYALLIGASWFVAVSSAEFLGFKAAGAYVLSVLVASLACFAVLGLNSYYFPHSFFAIQFGRAYQISLWSTMPLLAVLTVAAFVNSYQRRRHTFFAAFFVALAVGLTFWQIKLNQPIKPTPMLATSTQPNIIFIGLDSVRPDYVHALGNEGASTPNIDQFLQSSAVFTENYTALARTFPSWVSVLTGKHPIHTGARNNLAEASAVIAGNTLPKILQQAGYDTVYATDEKRFSNITPAFGFNRVLGPKMGVNDFLIGGLTDLPLTNLLVNLPFGRYLFPYNYANRAAAITYTTDAFLGLVKEDLANRSNKPLFLNVHLCLAHWPYFHGRDGQPDNLNAATFYKNGVQAVDKQLGELMQLLAESGVLKNAIVVLLSDHGTTMGLIGDRAISERNYRGDPAKIKLMTIAKVSNASARTLDIKNGYSISAVYGQGTDVLSLKQHHTLLAMRGFGVNIPRQTITARTTLMDIAPTMLDVLSLPALPQTDGLSLHGLLFNKGGNQTQVLNRPFYFETGDKIGEIETDKIAVASVVKKRIDSYQIDEAGLLVLNPIAEKTLVHNKQRAILSGDWLLARYPSEKRQRLRLNSAKDSKEIMMKSYRVKSYYVLLNMKTKEWTIDLDTPFAKKAPVKALEAQLKAFYKDEF